MSRLPSHRLPKYGYTLWMRCERYIRIENKEQSEALDRLGFGAMNLWHDTGTIDRKQDYAE